MGARPRANKLLPASSFFDPYDSPGSLLFSPCFYKEAEARRRYAAFVMCVSGGSGLGPRPGYSIQSLGAKVQVPI